MVGVRGSLAATRLRTKERSLPGNTPGPPIRSGLRDTAGASRLLQIRDLQLSKLKCGESLVLTHCLGF